MGTRLCPCKPETNIEVQDCWCVFALTNSRKERLKKKRFFLVYFPPLCSFPAPSLNLPALRELMINQLQLRQLRQLRGCQTSCLCSGLRLLILTVTHIINLVAVKRSPPSPIFLAVFCRRTRPAGKSEAATDQPSEGKTLSRCSSPGC